MKTLFELVKRNIKLFFNDKGMLLTSLITPGILLLLYATFLFKVYQESFSSALPEGFIVSDKLIKGCVGGQLISSLLAVACVTVAFCSNMIFVQDKVNGTIKDLTISPVKSSTLALSYYFATFINTLIICIIALAICLIYVAFIGWYLSFADVLLLILNIIIMVLFGTALSSIVNVFIKTQGQMTAVGTIVSAAYGFICGAYMPISQFSKGLQNIIMFFPGTYGTSLIRNFSLRGVYKEMLKEGFPSEVVEGIKDSIDCNLYFFNNQVSIKTMYLIIFLVTLCLIGFYILINIRKHKKITFNKKRCS